MARPTGRLHAIRLRLQHGHAAAQFDHSGRNADASYGLEVDTGQADADFFFTGSWDKYTRDQALQVAYQGYDFAKLDSTALYTHDHIEAKDARSESKNAAVRSYLVDSHEAQRQETASVADASIPFETQVAQVQNDYASGLQQRWGIWAGDVALADYHQSVNVADLDVDLSNDKQPWENVRTIADSDAVYAMGESVAGARETLVASWATALGRETGRSTFFAAN